MKLLLQKTDKNGVVSIERVSGFGSNCISATSDLESALGLVDESTRLYTDEYNEPGETFVTPEILQ